MKAPRNTREEEAYQRVVYPGSDVYRNKLGIRDQNLLERTERLVTGLRAQQDFPRSANCRTYAGFRAIHRHLFQDMYTWAGKERAYTTGRGASPFALPEHIGSWIEQQFTELARHRHLVGAPLTTFADAAARYVIEINAAHPFIDGNGRTQRFWLRSLAQNAGFELTLTSDDRQRWNEASRRGFIAAEHGPMAELLMARLSPIEVPARLGRPSGEAV